MEVQEVYSESNLFEARQLQVWLGLPSNPNQAIYKVSAIDAALCCIPTFPLGNETPAFSLILDRYLNLIVMSTANNIPISQLQSLYLDKNEGISLIFKLTNLIASLKPFKMI